MKQSGTYVVHAAAVRDAAGVNAVPGAVLVQDGRVIAAGEPESLPRELVQKADLIERHNDLLLPAMVNAHTHLELTDIGPQPYDPADGFVGWVKMVRERTELLKKQASQMHRSLGGLTALKRGIHMQSLPSGVQAVGDIVSHPGRSLLLEHGPLGGVAFVELFGIGDPFDTEALALIEEVSCGLQPHAPYSAGPALFDAAARSGKRVSTHLAETMEEVRFVERMEGPQLDYLKSIGKWDDAFLAYYGQGLSPVEWMRSSLELASGDGGWLVAHCNYVSDDDIKLLADTNTSVAYCPIASEYFGHENHRYRDMLAWGVNVCLGTDSIVGTDSDDPQPLGLLGAMRRLYRRDQTDPQTLLAMATVNGARALRLDSNMATLLPGARAHLAGIPIDPDNHTDPLVQVLTGQEPVEAISFEVDY